MLYRLVGQRELHLIAASDHRAFPPRLAWQPIFYPVTNEECAVQIARDWNTKDAENGAVGYVTRFSLPAEYLARFPVQTLAAGDTPNCGCRRKSWTSSTGRSSDRSKSSTSSGPPDDGDDGGPRRATVRSGTRDSFL